jgi:hydrogenase 3 maturation protease
VTARRRGAGLPAGFTSSFYGEIAEARRLGKLISTTRKEQRRLLVFGVGNELRGDDGVGVLVAADLAASDDELFTSAPVGIAIENASHLPGRLGADLVVIVDAVVSSGRRLRPWQLLPVSAADTFCHTTHSIPLSLLARYWQHERPGLEVVLLGIRIESNAENTAISPGVLLARQSVVDVVRAGLGRRVVSSPGK